MDYTLLPPPLPTPPVTVRTPTPPQSPNPKRLKTTPPPPPTSKNILGGCAVSFGARDKQKARK